MTVAELALELSLKLRSGQKLLAQFRDDRASERIRHSPVCLPGTEKLIDLIVSSLRASRFALGNHHLGVKFGHLLVRYELAIRRNEAVVSFEFLHRRVLTREIFLSIL